jgi:D-ribose pyranase
MLASHELLNPLVLRALASAGHGDLIVVADAGLPLMGCTVIDLSLTPGVPSFLEVAAAVRRALCVESAIVATESRSQPFHDDLLSLIAPIPIEYLSHEGFKARIRDAAAIIRTGECVPYSNVAFVAGTTF